MKKILFFVPLVLAVLAGCEKEVVEDDPIRMDPDHLTYVEEGVRLIAGAEQSRVSFELQPGVDEGTYVASKMAWEEGDIIKVWYNGKIRRFVTTTAGRQGTFYPVNESDVISRDEFDPSNPKRLVAYYNVSSVESDGTAAFTIAAVQTEGEASNKIPLYENIDEAVLEDNQIVMVFKPMASVVDFSVSAGAAAGKDGSGNQLVSYPEDFSYQLTKVVLTPNSGTGWTTGSCTFNPSTGAVSTVTTSLSAITFNFANATDIAIAGGRHFQMIVGQCQLDHTGATMDWYKGEAQNYTKSIWASKDIDLTDSSPKYLFQGINPKAVGLYDYDDYDTKFYANRAAQDANYINICDDERNIILTGDIDLLPSEDPSAFRNVSFPGLTWNFDGKGHKIYNFYSTDTKRLVALFSSLEADIRNVQFGDPDGAHNSIDISDNGSGGTFAIINSMLSGTVENVTSYLDWTVTASSTTANCYLGGIVGNLNGGSVRNCYNYGSITLIKGAGNTTGNYIAAGIVANVGGAIRIEGCTNEAPVSISGDFSRAIYCGGVVGSLGLACTLTGCTNYANVSVENTNTTDQSEGDCYIRAAGILSRVGSTSDPAKKSTISDCVNCGNVDAAIAAPVKIYYISGLVADFQAGHTMSGCVQRGNVSATQAGVYNNASVGWLSVWCGSTVESANVLKGIKLNDITVRETNYYVRNIWSRNDNPGTLTLITE